MPRKTLIGPGAEPPADKRARTAAETEGSPRTAKRGDAAAKRGASSAPGAERAGGRGAQRRPEAISGAAAKRARTAANRQAAADLSIFERVAAAVPKGVWVRWSGRQHKILDEQADTYQLPLRGETLDLPALARAYHDLLARIAPLFAAASEDAAADGETLSVAYLRAKTRKTEQEVRIAAVKANEAEGRSIPIERHAAALDELTYLYIAAFDRLAADLVARLEPQRQRQIQTRVDELRSELADKVQQMEVLR